MRSGPLGPAGMGRPRGILSPHNRGMNLLFQQLKRLGDDPILGVMTRFRADPSPTKVDLGVGVYRDPLGNTPVLDCVRRAEQAVLADQTSKTYVAPAGRAEFNTLVTELVLGAGHPALQDGRVRTLQVPGGCGALRVGAELLRLAAARTRVHVSTPTWGNHLPLLGNSGLELMRYPYYDTAANRLEFERMLQSLEAAAAGDVVLIHACCHNPTGEDLAADQWTAVIEVLQRRGLVPFLDLAYQGFGTDLESDAQAVRRVAAAVPEALIAVSCSKNLGLYRERVGALISVSADPGQADAVQSQLLQIARSIYSMPPDHGAAIAARIFADPALRASWVQELAAMRARLVAMRALLTQSLREVTDGPAFDFIRGQRGMFSLLGLAPEKVERLREQHHVYMLADSRINIAGLMPHNARHVAEAIAAVL